MALSIYSKVHETSCNRQPEWGVALQQRLDDFNGALELRPPVGVTAFHRCTEEAVDILHIRQKSRRIRLRITVVRWVPDGIDAHHDEHIHKNGRDVIGSGSR